MSNDTIFGGLGDDIIFGGIGDDVIAGGLGADTMYGGTGIDLLSYSDATTRVVVDMLSGSTLGEFAVGDIFSEFENLGGGQANDLLLGDADGNFIFGRAGDDELQGRFGNDTLEGGAGADTLDGSGNVDTAVYTLSGSAVTVFLFNGTATGGDAAGDVFLKIDNLIGSAFADNLTGTFTQNVIEGGAGADTMNGGAGVDTLSYARDQAGVAVSLETGVATGGDAAGDSFSNFENLEGGGGADMLAGDNGGNWLWGNGGADTLTGQDGDDTLEGGSGGDDLQGGLGSDWAAYTRADMGVTVNLATGIHSGSDGTGDTLASIENLLGSDWDDVLTGDSFGNVIEGGDGADTLEGGGGIDTLSYAGSNTRVVVDLLNGNVFLGHAEGDVISGFENLTGSRLPDYLLGSHDDNILSGGAGIDRLEARNGNDTLIGGSQDDNLKGGLGADVFVLRVGDAQDTIADWQDGVDIIDVSDFGLSFGQVYSVATDIAGGTLLIDFGGGDSVRVLNFALSDFDAGDVFV